MLRNCISDHLHALTVKAGTRTVSLLLVKCYLWTAPACAFFLRAVSADPYLSVRPSPRFHSSSHFKRPTEISLLSCLMLSHCLRGVCSSSPQVWRTLSRSARTSCLPSCNANIQRERGEIWVFCDVLHSEQVGRFLKEELRLSGRIGLSVRRLGNVFSM